jgi:hypothetical protein
MMCKALAFDFRDRIFDTYRVPSKCSSEFGGREMSRGRVEQEPQQRAFVIEGLDLSKLANHACHAMCAEDGTKPAEDTGAGPPLATPRIDCRHPAAVDDWRAGAARDNIALPMLKRRRPLKDWPARQLVDHVETCFASNPDAFEVRASVVFYQELAQLPKDTATEAAEEAAAAGEAFDEFPEFVAFHFGFSEEDRVELYMDFDRTCLVRGVEAVTTLAVAKEEAADWVGEGAIELPFEFLPGVYQFAFIDYLTGQYHDAHETEFMWALPPSDGNAYIPFREFPPKVKPTEFTPDPAKVSFGLLPLEAVQQLYASRRANLGW